jgi:hypothetical protein
MLQPRRGRQSLNGVAFRARLSFFSLRHSRNDRPLGEFSAIADWRIQTITEVDNDEFNTFSSPIARVDQRWVGPELLRGIAMDPS